MVDPSDHHPLSRGVTPITLGDTSNVPIRYRPRFTITEAIILNLLVNASPRHVTTDEILRQLRRYSPHGVGVMASSLKQAMVQLRAKLGEKAWDPQQIVTVKRKFKQPGSDREQWHTVGYQWVDPERGR